MKTGDMVIAKVTSYRLSGSSSRVPKITPETPVWVIGTYVEKSDYWDYNIDGEEFLVGPTFTEEELDALDWDGNYSLGRSYDEWELLPEDEWPDEVYAALAKRALLGKGDDK